MAPVPAAAATHRFRFFFPTPTAFFCFPPPQKLPPDPPLLRSPPRRRRRRGALPTARRQRGRRARARRGVADGGAGSRGLRAPARSREAGLRPDLSARCAARGPDGCWEGPARAFTGERRRGAPGRPRPGRRWAETPGWDVTRGGRDPGPWRPAPPAAIAGGRSGGRSNAGGGGIRARPAGGSRRGLP